MHTLQDRSNFNRTVWQIKEFLSGGGDIRDRLNAAFTRALTGLHCENGTIWLYDRLGSDQISPYIIHGSTDNSYLRFRPGEGIIGEAVASGQAQNIQDFAVAEGHLRSLDIENLDQRGLMVIPLKSDFDAIGCIQAIAEKGQAFEEEEFELLDMFSLLAAIEIEKSELLISKKSTKTLLRLNHIEKTYGTGPTRVQALRGVNLNVSEGEFLVILGKSGCGKTTLLNVIGGIDTFDSGEYQFDGKSVGKARDKDLTQFRRENVGFIFQQYSLMQDLTAKENLLLVSSLSKAPGDADALLALVGLSGRADNYPSQMSGGEQQRVAIARALMKSPKLLLADEPTAALDEATGTAVLGVLDDMVRRTAVTLVMITHNPEIAKMADRVAKMREGRLSEIIVNHHPVKASELTW